MDPKFQSSFIPKGPIATTATVSRMTGSGERSFFGFIAKIIFAVTIILAIGVFAYGKYLQSSIAKMNQNLAAAKATLEPNTIRDLADLNLRLVSTQDLLSKHTVLSPLFDYLESATLRSVRFTDFAFATTEKGLTLTMSGQARGYAAVALQADTFNKSKYIKSPIFSDLTLDQEGNVVFVARALVDPSIISYKKQVESIAVPVALPAAPVAPAATTTATTTTKVSPAATSTKPVATTTSPRP